MKSLRFLILAVYFTLNISPIFGDYEIQDPSNNCPQNECNDECWKLCCTIQTTTHHKWVCVEEPECYKAKYVKYVPKYYDVRKCRYVPEYYYETHCRYEPQYYEQEETKMVKKWVCQEECVEEPCYYYERVCKNPCCPNPQPCVTN